jgi:ketosteroid isomerase-like protein
MRFVASLMTVFCTMPLLVSAQDDSDRATQSKIVALEKVLVNDDGSVQDKGEFLASVKKPNSQEQQVTPESIAVHVYGNAATATGVFRAKGIEGGKPYLERERFPDTWIYKDGKWRCATAAAITVAH